MFRKAKTWFSHLSKAGKTGVILASLFVVGAAASPSNNNPTPPPDPEPVAQTQEVQADTVETKTITETEEIPFKNTQKEDSSLDKGKKVAQTKGVNGEKTYTYEVTYTNGKETGRKLAKEEVTRKPVNQVTLVGTYVYVSPAPAPQSNCDPNYSPCIPNVSYDLDCGDIGMTVNVVGYDKHRLDRDKDGLGCE